VSRQESRDGGGNLWDEGESDEVVTSPGIIRRHYSCIGEQDTRYNYYMGIISVPDNLRDSWYKASGKDDDRGLIFVTAVLLPAIGRSPFSTAPV
jgi:hypothetical protein